MDHDELTEVLRQTFDDERLSRPERDALRQVVNEFADDEDRLRFLRNQAFDLARGALPDSHCRDVLSWLESIIQTIDAGRSLPPKVQSCAYFSPGNQCLCSVQQLMRSSSRTMDLCVFTITDDRIKRSLVEAFERGVQVRLITDDGKVDDAGSDIASLRDRGVAVAVDTCNQLMHHKFAIFDDHQLLSGSFNWTRSATCANYENLIVTNDPNLIAAFKKEFEQLWARLPRLS